MTPTGTAVAVLSGKQVQVTWTATPGVAYSVEASTNTAFTSDRVVVAAPAGASSATVAGLMPGTRYYFRVQAVGGGYSPRTTAVTGPGLAGGPTNLTATVASANQVNLTWQDNSSAENGFNVEVARDPNFTQNLAFVRTARNATGVSVKSLAAGVQYYFRVQAVLVGGGSDFSAAKSAFTFGVPAAPGSLAAVPTSSTAVRLTWRDFSAVETGFVIDRATNGAFTAGLVSTNVAANITTQTLTGLVPGTTYYFRVRAVNGAGASANTATATAATFGTPAAPTGLRVFVASASQINLVWSDNSGVETGFEVERATDAGFTQNVVSMSVGANATTFAASGLTGGTRYYFRVRAVSGGVASAYTNTSSALLP